MSRIRGKDTKPELIVRKFLFNQGLRYRLHDKKLPGKPDIILPKYKTIIFIHGCFWHGHEGCKYFVVPKTRTNWWLDKIRKTITHDSLIFNRLIEQGWQINIIWECQLKNEKRENTLQDLLLNLLKKLPCNFK